MDTTDPHFEDPRLLAVAAVAGLVLFTAVAKDSPASPPRRCSAASSPASPSPAV
jgi:hypothetical protein